MKLKKSIVLLLMCMCVFNTFAEENLLDANDLDNLFNEDSENGESAESEATPDAGDDALAMLFTPGITFGANYQVFAGYGTGIINPSWKGTAAEPEWKNTGLLGLRSIFTVDASIAQNFRVLQKWQYEFPEYEFLLKEFFADSDFQNTIFLRVGVQNINWSESRNFNHTNLFNRLPDGFIDDDYKRLSYAIKMDVPLGIGGVQLLALTKPGFWADPDAPDNTEIGYGVKGNVVVSLDQTSIDINTGYYYHKELNHRAFLSASGTICNNWEVYAEALIAINPSFTNYYYDENGVLVDQADFDADTGYVDNYLDYSFNIGIYSDAFDGSLKFGAEYYFNGEESEIDEVSLYHGHNGAIYAAYKAGPAEVSVKGKFNYDSLTEGSAILVPAIVYDLHENLMLSLAVPVILGGLKGALVVDNPDDYNREAAGILRIIVHGKL